MERLKAVLKNQGENYMLPFFWQHGEDVSTLREYMQVIHDANIGAVCVESRPHPDFAGEKWWQDMDVILDEAKKLDMKVWILDDSHFPTGFANGALKNAPKELHHKYLCHRTLEMAGPARHVEFRVKDYMKPAPLPPWMPQKPESDDDFFDDQLVKIVACPFCENEEYGEPIDLTENICGENVIFNLPDGYYRIFVVYISRNGEGRNDYINFMDKASCRLLIDAVYEPHYARYKQYFGNVIAGFFSDEPPVGNVAGYTPLGPVGTNRQNLAWSAAATELMTETYGSEDWMLLTPYLWGDATDKIKQAKVRNAYMEMATKLVAQCFSAQNGEWCRARGVEYIGHQLEDCDMSTSMGASMGHFFRGLSGQHMAGVDNIGGQVMINAHHVPRHDQGACRDEAGFYHYMLGKMGASHGAIDPKKAGRCLCENFGAYGWQSGPKEQKFMMDHFLVRGVNRYVPHAFSPKAFPDPDCPPHFYAHGENPTYRAFGELMAYSNRVCHLIDGGRPCPDVALLYNAESVWSGGADSNIPACRYLSRAQVDFHIIPADVFDDTDEYPMSFDGKCLTVNGISYGALVISGCEFMDAQAADFVVKAAGQGYLVVFTDKKPTGIVGAASEENTCFTRAIEKIPCVPVTQIGTFLKENNRIAVNTRIEPENPRMTTYHYRLEDCDEYFILNEMAEEIFTGEAIVRADGFPVRYYPWENRLDTVDCEKTGDDVCRLKLTIQPLELGIIIFVKDFAQLKCLETIAPGANSSSAAAGENKIVINEFKVGRVAAKDYLAQLRTAGESIRTKKAVVIAGQQETVRAPFSGMQDQYPDFSGYYIYEAKVKLAGGRQYELVIDDVCETAEAYMNGESLGVKVQGPYRFVIPENLVKTGENCLRIEVATLLERKVRAMGVNFAAMSANRPMSPTGILGKVTIK